MYFLEKFCRICIQTGVQLVDINIVDFDSIRLSEKLKICTKLVVTKETISSEICQKCVNKLRVAYHFQDMCKKSTKLIQEYIDKLTGHQHLLIETDRKGSEFENSDLSVMIEQLSESKCSDLSHDDDDGDNEDNEDENEGALNLSSDITHCESLAYKRKQRITKQQRCSLLKQLLTPGGKPKKERDKLLYFNNTFNFDKGGLKNIINFTKNYEFSLNLDKNSNIETTPLDKLTAFSTNFFQRDFTEFKTHILHIIENKDRFENVSSYSTDDEDNMSDCELDDAKEKKQLSFEEVIVEPDIKIKSEMMNCEEEEEGCPLDYLETSIEEDDEEEIKVKKEVDFSNDSQECSTKINDFSMNRMSNYYNKSNIKEKMMLKKSKAIFDIKNDGIARPTSYSSDHDTSHSVKLLDKLVSSYPICSRKVFSPNNVRCRTRNNPYINPLLKDQFLFRSFRCDRCNRYFKSQGYLKAHTSKVH